MSCTMDYNHDTEQDLLWAGSQLRKEQNQGLRIEDAPIRRITAGLAQAGKPPDPAVGEDTTLGTALSALDIHKHSEADCCRIMESLLQLMSDKNRLGLHPELVQLKGLDQVLSAVRRHHDGECAVVALRLLDKLSRTCGRDIAAAGGIDVLLERCNLDKEPPRVSAAAIRVLHGLTFDGEVRPLLLRRGVRGLAQAVVERGPGDGVEEGDLHSIGVRLLNRLGEGERGYSNKWEAPGMPKIALH